MCCGLITFAQATCLQLWEQCRAIGSALLSVFQRNVPDLTCNHTLSHRKVRVGGVENTGNSCIFAAMLQDFATLPQIYDSLLYSFPRKGPEELESRFIVRQTMHQCLVRNVEKIRSGKQVEHAEVRTLAEQLQRLGWQGHLSSAWRCFLHRLAPGIFTLPHFNVYELYERTLNCLLEQKPLAPMQIIFTGKENTRSFSGFFASHPQFSKMDIPVLWRVSLNTSLTSLEERFQIGVWEFSLRIVHAYRMTPAGKHVVVYRKCEEEWVCCNDTQTTLAIPPATDNTYMVVYESRRL